MEKRFDTPLSVKLGIHQDSTFVLLHAPSSFTIELPGSVNVRRRSVKHADVVLQFFTETAKLERRIGTLIPMVFPSGGLWIAWPKKTSSVVTDITDHAVRSVVLPLGLVDNKVCAIDENWTALRFAWRRTERSTIH
jgi:hypothetical protein